MLNTSFDSVCRIIVKFCTASILTTALSVLLSGAVYADASEIDMALSKHIDSRGAALFSNPIPGETFDPITGKLGHKATDMHVVGNGLVPMTIQRNFEEIAGAYPHAFGSMSLQVPQLVFETSSPLAQVKSCQSWNASTWNAIRFEHNGGHETLISRGYISTDLLSEIDQGAAFVSKNNWILKCDGDSYSVHAPDGTVYSLSVFEFSASRRKPSAKRSVINTTKVRILARTVTRAGTTLKYEYVAHQGDAIANKPYIFGWKASYITGKRLVSRMVIEGSINHYREINITYRNPAGSCPNQVETITSPHAPGGNLSYAYEPGNCRLEKVTFEDGSFTKYTYGLTPGNQFQYLPVGPKLNAPIYRYEPIRTIKLRTGALVTYDYGALHTCEFESVLKSGGCSRDRRRPTLAVRTLTGSDIPNSVHNIGYHRNDSATTLTRFIDSDKRRHELVFGYIDRHTPPYTSTTLSGKLLHSGKLLKHTVTNWGSPQKLSETTYQYFVPQELNGVSLDFVNWDKVTPYYPPSSVSDFVLRASRYAWVYDALRVNLQTRTVKTNRHETVSTVWRSYNIYNQPTRIDRKNSTRADKNTMTAINYDNDWRGKSRWIIGLPVNERTGSISPGEPGGKLMQINRAFNNQGLMTTENRHGIVTTYTYNSHGDVDTITDGNNNTTSFANYRMGVARQVRPATGGVVGHAVDARGLITRTVDNAGWENSTRFDDIGREIQSWIGADVRDKATVVHPNWNSSLKTQRVGQGDFRRDTTFDSLGRVIRVRELDTGSNRSIHKRFGYDAAGRLEFESDPRSTDLGKVGNWPGTRYQYDALNRITVRKHTAESNSINTCYAAVDGEKCSVIGKGGGSFGPLLNGFVVTDQEGYVTLYNQAAFGSPDKARLKQVIQQVDDNGAVETLMDYNRFGFRTAVSQGTFGSNDHVQRRYLPYETADTLTFDILSESHPEFGTRSVLNYDGNRNVKTIRNYSGNLLNYTYTKDNQIDTVNSPTYQADYDYLRNGQLQRAWTKGQVPHSVNTEWLYTYDSETQQIDTETLNVDSLSFKLDYGYNNQTNQLKALTYPDGTRLDISPNAFGETEALSVVSGGKTHQLVSGAKYHPTGALSSATMGNGQIYSAQFDNRSLLKTLSSEHAVTGNNTIELQYHYDGRRNISRIDNYFYPYSLGVSNLQYDGLGRLKKADGHWGKASYTYDSLGNINRLSLDGYTVDYVYDDENLLRSVNLLQGNAFDAPSYASIDYDGNGNVISNSILDMSYDELNQMLTLNDGGVSVQSNTYDANGMRTRVKVQSNGKTRHTYSVYSADGSLMSELDPESNETRNHIYLAGQMIAMMANHTNADSDGDWIPDYYERLHGLDPDNKDDAQLDPDKDGVDNVAEFRLGSLAQSSDSDDDGLPDGWEWAHQGRLDDASDAVEDADNDGVSNINEFIAGSNPIGHRAFATVNLVPSVQILLP